MRKALLLAMFAFLFLGMVGSLVAQTNVTIGSGTAVNTTNTAPTPYGTYYKNFRQQYLILASEIEDAGGGTGNINSVAFEVQNLNNCIAMPNFTIKMRQTTLTELTTTFEVGDYTTVFTSTEYMPVAGWNTHTFTAPFAWDGTSNIIVDIITTLIPVAYTQNASVFYTPTTFQSSLRYQNDTLSAADATTGTLSPNRANIRFNMPSLVVTNPPNPANLISPLVGNYVMMPPVLNWSSGGGVPASYDVHFGTTPDPPYVTNTIETSYSPTVSGGTTYYWKIVPRNAIGTASNCPVWNFRTPSDAMIAESFEATTFPPLGWANQTGFSRSTSYAYHGAASAYKYSSSTAPAILSTPVLNIVQGSTIQFFARTTATNDNQRIQVKYSTDRTTWTSIGEPITLAANAAFAPYSVDLSSAAGNYYIGLEVSTTSLAGGVYIDMIFAPEVVPMVPDPVTLNAPADAAVNVNEIASLTWTGASTGGIPTGFKVFLDNNPEPSTLVATVAASPYTVTAPLSYGATYYWKVVATNGAGDSQPSAIRSFTVRENPIVSTFPWNVNFGTTTADTFPPQNWTKHSGVLAEPTVLGAHPTGSWIMDDWLNITSEPNKAARINIYSTLNGWLITPPINLPGNDYQVEFDLGLVDYGNSNPPEATGPDDKFAVLVGDGISWTPANLLRIWDNEGSPYVYNNIATAGERVILSLAGHTGIRYIAFYGISTASNADNDLMIDNVTVRQSPSTPIFSVTPTEWDHGSVLLGVNNAKQFVVSNDGVGTLSVASVSISGSPFFTLTGLPTMPQNLTFGQNFTFSVNYNPTTAGNHSATITVTDNRMVHTIQLTGIGVDATIYTLPYLQNFDAVTVPALPVDWSKIYQASVTTGYVKTVTTSPQSAPNCAAMYNPTDANTIAMLIAPPLNTTLAANSTRVKFYAKGATTHTLQIGVMTDPTNAETFVMVQSVPLTAAWAEYSIPLTSYTGTGRYIAFKHGNAATGQTMYIDTITIEQIAANDLAAVRVTGNNIPSVNNNTPYTIQVLNNGTTTQSNYTVKLLNAENIELGTAAGTSVAAGETVDVIVNWTPTTEGPYVLYGKVILAGDINSVNDTSPAFNITVMPAGIVPITVGDGNLTGRYPVDMYYKNSVNQTLYYSNEIGIIGNILTVSLYNNFVTTTIGSKPIKLWMQNTELADLSAGWAPATDMTLVFDGMVNFPGGMNTITIPLTTPFNYTGGNLLLMWNRPMDVGFFSSSDVFKTQTIGNNRTRNITSDSTVYDPLNMTATGTLSGNFPQTTFVLSPSGGTPVARITPTSKDFGTVLLNSTHNQEFSIMNIGGGQLGINSITISGSPMFSLQNMPTLPASLNTGQTLSFVARYNPTVAAVHAATITVTDNLGRSYQMKVNPDARGENRSENNRQVTTIALSGTCIDTTINTLPYVQGFDQVTPPALPPDWLKLVQSTASALVQTYTTTPHSNPNTAGMTNSSDANATAILIAPPLATTIPTNTTRVKFWGRSSGAAYALSVGVMSDAINAMTYTEVQNIALTTTWTEYVVTFAGYTGTGKHVAFKHGLGGTSRTIYIDDVMIEIIPTNDLAALNVTGNTTPSVGSSSIYTVNVFNWGSAPQSTYTVNLHSEDGTVIASAPGVAVAPGATAQVPVTWTPTVEGAATIYATVVLTGDENALNNQSPNLSVVVLQSGIFAFTVGEGNQTANIPINLYYESSLYETLYYPSEMGNFMGTITAVQLYGTFTQELLDKPVKVWIGTTTQNDLTNWIPSTDLTLVFDGTLDFPLGDQIITIPFDNPYLYLNGENLVMMFFRPSEGAYWQSSNVFKCQTDAINTARAKRVQSDSIIYDPATPPAVTASAQFPKTTFLGIPGGVGHLNGTVLGAGNQPLQGVSVQIPTTTYSTLTNELGQYEIRNILPDSYSVSFSKYGYVTQTQQFTLEEDETETVNVTLVPMATVTLSGTVLASDTAAGLSGATIEFVGYQNYSATTAANGTFSIPVYANQNYTYTASHSGYVNATGVVNVGATNHTMPNMTLLEVAFAPYGVVATESADPVQVNLVWNAPNPLAVDMVESFEAPTFPPANWTRVINNTGPANDNGVLPTWCSFGENTYYGYPAVPTHGNKQAGIGFAYAHQDEWLISHAFYCPPEATFSFTTFVFRGSVYGDNYYVKVSTNGGTDWTVLWNASTLNGGYTTTAIPVNINMAEYGGQQIKIAFHADDPSTDDGLWYDWYIDNIRIANVVTAFSFNPEEMIQLSASSADAKAAPSKAGFEAGRQRALSNASNNEPRSITGYKVWRLRAGEENNQNVWNLLTPDAVSNLNFADTGWSTLGNGTYRWAVKAIYTNNVASIPVLSNSILKQVISGTIQGWVRKPNNQPLAGAVVTAGANSAITNSNGLYSLSVPVGTYSVSCTATGYANNTVNNINVIANQSVTVNFNMLVSSNDDDLIPVTVTALNGNYPNPFNPETSISYSIKEAGDVSLEVYNLKGQKVRSLVNIKQNSGHYRVVFDGKDDKGQPLSSGIYLYRLSTGSYVSTRKMMLME